METVNSMLCHVLLKCLIETSSLLVWPFLPEILLQRGEEVE